MLYADWFNCCDITRHALTSDASSTQISYQNIHLSRKNKHTPFKVKTLLKWNMGENGAS